MPDLVLIVEDNESVAVSLELALQRVDIQVCIVPDPIEAIKLLAGGTNNIRALITDIHLPHMDGFALIRYVRAIRQHDRMPIFVISGDTSPETPQKVIKIGANAYFQKPFSPLEIRDKLESLLHGE